MNSWLQPDALTGYVGRDSALAVPLAVVVGGPAYIDGYAALPLTRALLEHGMSSGAAMAFLVSGGGREHLGSHGDLPHPQAEAVPALSRARGRRLDVERMGLRGAALMPRGPAAPPRSAFQYGPGTISLPSKKRPGQEPGQVVARRPVGQQVGHDAAYGRADAEAVAAEPGGENKGP